MTEQQIEVSVERQIDAIDRRYMSNDNTWTEAEYKAEIKRVDDWSKDQLRQIGIPV